MSQNWNGGLSFNMSKLLPIIKVKQLTEGTCGFRCPYCKRMHIHGMANGHPNGSRVSHCTNPRSIWFGIEYYIILEVEER